MTYSMLFHLNLAVAGCGGLWRIWRYLPEGYEDEAGFHFGLQPVGAKARVPA